MSQANGEMPLIDHLIELRDRLLRCVIVIGVLFVALVAFANDIYGFVAEPLQSILPDGTSMIATEVASPFLAPFKLTLWVCVMLAMPVLLNQLWGFIAPALYDNEKKLMLPLMASSVFLFYAGIAFAYAVVLPLVFGFFTAIGPDGVEIATDINSYLSFVLSLFFVFGLAFEIPIAIYLLIRTGAVAPETLAKKRTYVFLGCFVVGMLVTPPDVISQTILAVPMYLLFEVGLLLGRIGYKPPTDADSDDLDPNDLDQRDGEIGTQSLTRGPGPTGAKPEDIGPP